MSLIQEALKRKMEEKGGAAPAASPPPPPAALATPPPALASIPAPVPVPSGMTVREPAPDRGNVVKIVGMVGAILVMVSLAGVLIFMAVKSWSNKDSSPTQAAPSVKPLSVVSTPAAAPIPPPGQGQAASPVASISDRVADMKGKVLDSQNEGAEITGGRPPEPAPLAAPVAAAAPPPPRAEPAPAFGAGGGTPVIQAQEFSLWPRVTVNGILAKGTKGRGMAIINNQMMSVNESVEGVRLVEVKGQGVLLEFGGESRFVEIGQTIQ